MTAVFSTPSTSKSSYLDDLIEKFAPGMTVFRVGESSLEHFIEEGRVHGPQIEAILRKEIAPLLSQGVDAIALGCTHYPFVKEEIEKIVGTAVAVCDSGGAVARRLKQVLEHEDLLALQKDRDRYYTTGEAEKFSKVASTLLREDVKAEYLEL
jgi:glutamate racemase